MKLSTAVKLYLIVCALAVGFLAYAVGMDGWESAKYTVFWTVVIFGGVGLVWFIGDKVSRQ